MTFPVLLAALDVTAWIVGAVGVLLGAGIAVVFMKLVIGQTLAKAREQAAQITKLAESEASTLVQKAEVEAQKRSIAEREKVDAEVRKRRDEIREAERALAKREDQHERKLEVLALKEAELNRTRESLAQRDQKLAAREKDLDALIEQQKSELLRVANLTPEQARERVLAMVEEDAREDAAKIAR